ncbi:hypothetical protein KNU64_gp90 [Gordonia Phage Lollipop1437]|uniref:Uncharacterized protein n=1 Tax=Gordonia Phage Lollipop1437 TaxID=2588505 RepID=A0A4Y6EUY5_9CAUD|nr:hypothetical protein KNU64_gp90 [Gordonia Phage Lollipop1437]QDF19194.1 hypothetical protein SEA_LOLLIPOP1437_90 [Gordonia Phage Lollipop1437]
MIIHTAEEPGQLVTGSAWSASRPATINVIMPSIYNADGNNVYPRPSGPIVEAVRTAVMRAFREHRPGLVQRYPDAVVTVTPCHTARGRYRYTVWSHHP